MSMKIEPGKKLQCLHPLLVIDLSGKNNSPILPELIDKMSTVMIGSITHYHHFFSCPALRETIEYGPDIIFRLHTGYQQQVITRTEPIFLQHRRVGWDRQISPISDIFTVNPVFALQI